VRAPSEMLSIAYPTFLSKRIKNRASIWGASFSLAPASTCVALEEDMVVRDVHVVWRCGADDAAWARG
jgi:hypothetical protein